ncbi:Mpped1 [Symbiodinium necroappetens]|uniref:Mpped1 protein n=1 Tax=Symbiodinium necroappetens TaxID=1628268 RepID=A0A812S005_9DINO|nr:Mpped1 [Symbiodinium necroappetens]
MADVAYKRIDEQTRETSLLGKSAATANGTDSINSMVRIIVVSDTHGLHETLKMPAGDVLVHCGDMADRGNVEHVRSCIRWLNSLPYKEIFVVDQLMSWWPITTPSCLARLFHRIWSLGHGKAPKRSPEPC